MPVTRSTWTVASLSTLAITTGCPSPLPALGDDGTADSDAGGTVTSAGGTGSTGGSDGGTVAADTTSGDGACPRRCGSPHDCCEVDEECLNASCVAACASGIRCGAVLDACCAAGQLCIGSECVDAEGACIDDSDCAAGSFCDPSLGQCLPQPERPVCQVVPEPEPLDIVLEWSFEEDQITSIPVVGDIDGDMLPEVVVNTAYATDPDRSSYEFYGEIIVFDGTNGQEQLRVPNDPAGGSYGSYSRSTVGLADVDDDGLPDVVYVGRPAVNIAPFVNNSSLVHAINGLGQLLWTSHAPDGTPYYIYIRHGAPAFVNLDDDDASEIVYGTTVLDNDGTVVFDQDNEWARGGGVFGSNGDYLGGISAIADLTGDGYPEIISGRQAWSVSWDQPAMGPPDVELTLLWEYIGPDGFPAVADLDQDGDPEVVLVGDPAPYNVLDGIIIVLDGATGQLWCGVDPTDALCVANPSLRTGPISIPGGGRGGPPTIADFDGDGRPEIAVAGGSSYSVYDLNRVGEDVVQPAGNPPPGAGDIYVRWTSIIQDQSSNTTGSSVFDFQGDGIAETIYADECYLRVYAGDTGSLILEEQNSSVTIHEYPVVADVDADGRSELLVVANDQSAAADCGMIPGYVPRRGLFVYGDVNDQWARTRRVWNMHTYHVSNARSDGRVPSAETPHWSSPLLNSFRSNHLEIGAFYVPDLQVDLMADTSGCGEGSVVLDATVRNIGMAVVPAGVEVTLYEGIDASGVNLGVQPTRQSLTQGASTVVSWSLPDPPAPTSFFVNVSLAEAQCDDTNDGSVPVLVSCD